MSYNSSVIEAMPEQGTSLLRQSRSPVLLIILVFLAIGAIVYWGASPPTSWSTQQREMSEEAVWSTQQREMSEEAVWSTQQREMSEEAARLLARGKEASEQGRGYETDAALTTLLDLPTPYPRHESIRGEAMCTLAAVLPSPDNPASLAPVRAEAYFRKGAELLQRNPTDRVKAALCRASLAEFLVRRDRREEALSIVERTRKEIRDYRDSGDDGALLRITLSLLLAKLGKAEEGAPLLEAQPIALPHSPYIETVELAWAWVELSRGHYHAAIEHANRGLKVYQASRQRAERYQIEAYGLISEAHKALGYPAAAEFYLEKAIELQWYWQPTDPDLGATLRNLAIAERDQEKYLEAADHFAKAAQIYSHSGEHRADYAMCIMSAGDSYRKLKRPDDATRVLTEAAAMYKTLPDQADHVFQIERMLGEIAYDEGLYCDSYSYYREARRFGELDDDDPKLVELTRILADPHYRQRCVAAWRVQAEKAIRPAKR